MTGVVSQGLLIVFFLVILGSCYTINIKLSFFFLNPLTLI